MKGKFVMIDGLDGVGKGEVIKAIVDYERSSREVFDVNEFWGTNLEEPPKNNYNPHLFDFQGAQLLVTSEPTFAGIGRFIRTEYIKNNGRDYPPRVIAEAYALDRYDLYTSTIIPALAEGIDIVQSRGVITSIVYQMLDSKLRSSIALELDEITKMSGNEVALKAENAPSLLIIPTVNDIDQLFERLAGRDKKDDAIFEKKEFQQQLKSVYESAWLKEMFESLGTEVRYLDAGVSVEHSRSEALRIWKEHLKKHLKGD
jgi:thymidylate kinase